MVGKNAAFTKRQHELAASRPKQSGYPRWRAWLAQWINVRLPPLWPGFDSRTRLLIWVEFFVGCRLAPRVFFRVLRFSSGHSRKESLYRPQRILGNSEIQFSEVLQKSMKLSWNFKSGTIIKPNNHPSKGFRCFLEPPKKCWQIL